MEHYRLNSEQKDRKKALDRINKDLKEVEESDSFDIRKKRKAREILDNWKLGLLVSSDELLVRRLVQAGTARLKDSS
ncbi:9150_t:CDS:2 [Funneliformis mosseae]|uniref:9150_t:CDS:1 n=1 Tax=Funneliformis mosseae TaxID=27381 RepID=A0A9N8W017_FUNMO|nr:9150_t:CDS:2 [Funneliformis mosseae]